MSEEKTQLETLRRKLDPELFFEDEFPRWLIPLVSFILDGAWGAPSVPSLSITSDGFLVSAWANEFYGSAEDMDDAIGSLLLLAGLNSEERDAFTKMYRKKILDSRSERPHF